VNNQTLSLANNSAKALFMIHRRAPNEEKEKKKTPVKRHDPSENPFPASQAH
jgi:hypothetical protein